mmetsp:Transcript_6110/g.9554  ORF Transcript_6110/g.9554 Transcript_6110/m.9554 type:complete len:615 (+) Transcript_6110:37-1881(+)
MMRFTEYAICSTLLTGCVVFYAYATRIQFYPAVIYLVTSKPSIMVLGNMAFVFTIVVGQLTNKVFLGRLREAEREIIWENLRYAFTETCLALSTFREEMSLNVVVLFTALLFIKVFHWLCEARVEHLEQAQDTSRLSHIRTLCLMVALFFADLCCAGAALYVVQQNGASVQVFFGFEYVLLGIKIVEIFVKYCLSAVDTHFIQGQWYNRSLYELYLKLVIDVMQLFVNIVFFAIIFSYYGVPLHLMRQLYVAVRNVHDRLTHFWRFRRITSNLHERFPNATEEDLGATDRVCIICREEMVAGAGIGAPKKLAPCGHIFHFYCLRNWLERQLKCPTCRTDISSTRTPAPGAAAAEERAANQADPAAPNENAPIGDQAPQQAATPPPPVPGPGGQRAPDGGQRAPQNANPFFQQPQQWAQAPRPQYQAPPAPSPNLTQQVPQPAPGATQTAPGHPQIPVPPPMHGVHMPPLGFPMGLRPPTHSGASPIQHEIPSVAQYIRGQIEILQLQLQVYQAQVSAAEATKKAAEAAVRAKAFHDKQLEREAAKEPVVKQDAATSPTSRQDPSVSTVSVDDVPALVPRHREDDQGGEDTELRRRRSAAAAAAMARASGGTSNT